MALSIYIYIYTLRDSIGYLFLLTNSKVGKEAETYLNTSTAACRGCTIELVRAELSRVLCMELAPGSVCAWGELMCNPGYYNYLEP